MTEGPTCRPVFMDGHFVTDHPGLPIVHQFSCCYLSSSWTERTPQDKNTS